MSHTGWSKGHCSSANEQNAEHAVGALAIAVLTALTMLPVAAAAQQSNLDELQRQLDQAKRGSAPQAKASGGPKPDQKPAATPAAGKATLVVESDAPCELRIDGQRTATLKSKEAVVLIVDAGKQLVVCTSSEVDAVEFRGVVEAFSGTKDVLQMRLADRIQTSIRQRELERAQAAEAQRKQDADRVNAAAEEQRKMQEARANGGMPKLKDCVTPTYPRLASKYGAEGITTVRYTVDIDGTIGEVVVVKSAGSTTWHSTLDVAAMEYVRACRATPGLLGGRLAKLSATVDINWNLK